MKKILTIFDRDWQGSRHVVDKLIVDFPFDKALATEKLDGTNVRLTVRNHTLVRLEKRRNPSKIEKQKGVEEPWYTDAYDYNPGDKYIWDAARNTDLSNVDDGEWSGEAVGPKIQGNPLNLDKHVVVLFSLGQAPKLEDAPTTYEGLKRWLPTRKSEYGKDCFIEGVVWSHPTAGMVKIKTKDFKP